MIVDASAILAVLLKEPEEHLFADILVGAANKVALSPVNYLEVSLRVDRGDMPETSDKLDMILDRMNIAVVDITVEQAQLARQAYQNFGKRNHKGQLNLGDCFAYALSKARSEPLLFKGDDFRMTDVEAVI